VGLADGLAGAAPRAWRVVVGREQKRIQRLWREEGLRRPVRIRKRRRVAASVTERLRAERPNQVWAIDFQFDETLTGGG
jgi:transposase InsO family protein